MVIKKNKYLKKFSVKKFINPSKTTVKIKEKPIENVFDDESRFFNREMEETKKRLFFS
jgi:hypothetical protein